MSENKLQRELIDLAGASRDELIGHWRRLTKREPPRYASMEFLRRAAAYAMQERELGGPPQSLKRQLHAAARGKTLTNPVGLVHIKPGVRLLREWHGITHEVIVTDNGYVWEGHTYKSLSAVAQAISGAKWNGPRFFGIAKERNTTNG
ncbi:DUF2924 domain-containing protein [Hyphomicrobium sp.]|uniref:DUF2924 domain-containing protein n=1 Tax=Hyphomicrobium sp. TaxID=82 RepID=UPI001DDDA352|nr:DUF2924 domain-containing protein [Hyphomicrobium sp.]MBY0558593.1 DUF2924 domain-containing protein [Hyphomicrobium sp.]